MSVLTSKHVLVVGDENTQINNLEDVLRNHGVTIHVCSCSDVTTEYIDEQNIDLILFNHLHDGEACQNTLTALRTADLKKVTPIFVLVPDDNAKIQAALSNGATDYITPNESVESVTEKMKTVFDQGSDFAGVSAIDITPQHASVTATGIRVFVIEDDPLLRNLLSIRLDRSSFPYEFSSDGKNTVPAIKQFKPDIIILDLMLPGRTGFDVLKEIRANEDCRDIPVIVFSNRDGQEDRRQAEALGAVGFYVKAMTDLSELIETIESQVK